MITTFAVVIILQKIVVFRSVRGELLDFRRSHSDEENSHI
jgi:hypothetical protein